MYPKVPFCSLSAFNQRHLTSFVMLGWFSADLI